MKSNGLFVGVFCRFSDLPTRNYLSLVGAIENCLNFDNIHMGESTDENPFDVDLFLNYFDDFLGENTQNLVSRIISGDLGDIDVMIIKCVFPRFVKEYF